MVMEVKSYFEKIEDVIIEDIRASKRQLLIAVAWFTNHKIFDELIKKLNDNDGFTAKLIVINDNINNRIGGLDFQKFVSAGGSFYFAEKNIPMHNKYIVIDSNIVITGSYNYTYYAETLNEENVVRINGYGDIVQSYIKNFNNILKKKPVVSSVNEYLKAFPPSIDFFSYNNYALKDILLQAERYKQAGNIIEAQKLIEKTDNNVCSKKHECFVINNVIYKQWRKNYYVDKIEVRTDIITVFFRSNFHKELTLFSPETKKAWILHPSQNKDIISKSYAVRNIRVNGELLIEEAQKGITYELYHEKEGITHQDSEEIRYIKIPRDGILTCEVSFKTDNMELIDGTIDFIEGEKYDSFEDHWNAHNIQMKLNREWL